MRGGRGGSQDTNGLNIYIIPLFFRYLLVGQYVAAESVVLVSEASGWVGGWVTAKPFRTPGDVDQFDQTWNIPDRPDDGAYIYVHIYIYL